ncbi:MAG: NADPH-dependent 2,4-dienoyl-CoA reductase [Rhizobiaceae bacterium]
MCKDLDKTGSLNEPNARSSAAAFPHLLSPIIIGDLKLKNRMVMGAMHTRLETMDNPLDREIAFYAARAKGGIGLIISGGFSPNKEGLFEKDSLAMDAELDLGYQKSLCAAVVEAGSPFVAQLLHAGRYSRFNGCVGPSAIKSPINPYTPRPLTTQQVWSTIDDFARAAELARSCGYSGIEVMGSEGYLINQFLAKRANHRDDVFGGSAKKRMRFPVEIIRSIRKAVGNDFPLIFRISAIELVEDGMSQLEILELARWLENEGIDCFNTGIGWHESRVPTVSSVTPRAAFSKYTAAIKKVVDVPVIASNRINDPQIAEQVIANGDADLVSMARQMLADPAFANKCLEGRPEEINTCIACNQACLDKVFVGEVPTCLVNPRALREIEFPDTTADVSRRVAVVGGGAAGLTAASEASRRGHTVVLFEQKQNLGGLLNLASQVPDKSEFQELLRFLKNRIKRGKVEVQLNSAPDVAELAGFDEIIIATGVKPRVPQIEGIDHQNVAFYDDILSGKRMAGSRVAIVGSGGVGIDVAEFIIHGGPRTPNLEEFSREFGVTQESCVAGGFTADTQYCPEPKRKVTLLQRGSGKVGQNLSVTTRWIKLKRLHRAGVISLANVEYLAIDDEGLHVEIGSIPRLIEADTIVICAGQISNTSLPNELDAANISYNLVGGAKAADELDAMRAIDEATRLAMKI